MRTVYVVGIGPGSPDQMTAKAAKVLSDCDVIAGYTVYVDLIKGLYPGKKFITTPMRQEEARCTAAFEAASAGADVAVVCSGDAGVYGMAGLMYEVGVRYPDINVEVISGITAATAGAALLGAPLSHDFAVISLSDILTPWDKIEKRLRLSAEADLVICLYNPASRRRSDHLARACNILLEVKDPATVCGYVKNISRAGQEMGVMTLKEIAELKADMFTTVWIGNSQTRLIDGKMVTPRGYSLQKEGPDL